MNIQPIEKERWEAADQLRANPRLTVAAYSAMIIVSASTLLCIAINLGKLALL